MTDSNNEIFKDINYIKEKRKNIYVSSKSNGIDSIDSIDLSSLKKNSENLFSNSDKISNIISNIASSFLSKKNILLILQILYKKASEENIIEFLSLIGKHNHTANCIKVFSNNFWISIGNDLFVYNPVFYKIMEIKINYQVSKTNYKLNENEIMKIIKTLKYFYLQKIMNYI